MGAKQIPEAEQLKEFIRKNTRDHLSHLARIEEVGVNEITGQRVVLGHWISLILISGEKVRTTFRAHFGTNDAKLLASKAFSIEKNEVSPEQAYDFMKEFCNVCAGRLKRLLLQNNVDVGISLPFMTRGFDQIFDLPSKDKFAFEDKWHLTCGDASLDCSILVEASEPLKLTDFSSTEATEGQVDVL